MPTTPSGIERQSSMKYPTNGPESRLPRPRVVAIEVKNLWAGNVLATLQEQKLPLSKGQEQEGNGVTELTLRAILGAYSIHVYLNL